MLLGRKLHKWTATDKALGISLKSVTCTQVKSLRMTMGQFVSCYSWGLLMAYVHSGLYVPKKHKQSINHTWCWSVS